MTMLTTDNPIGLEFESNMLDKKIIERLFRQHYGEMTRLATTLLGNTTEAEDIVQDVFARLVENGTLTVGDKTRSYLLKSVHHACISTIRRRSLTEQVRHLYPVNGDSDVPTTERRIERYDAIQTFVDEQMTDPHHSIFHLRFDDDLTLSDEAMV